MSPISAWDPRKCTAAHRRISNNMPLLLEVPRSYKSTYNPYNAITVFGILWLQSNAAMKLLFPLDRIFDMTALCMIHSWQHCGKIRPFAEKVFHLTNRLPRDAAPVMRVLKSVVLTRCVLKSGTFGRYRKSPCRFQVFSSNIRHIQ
jgi:hypothetical protein